jgi:hypothetical protein
MHLSYVASAALTLVSILFPVPVAACTWGALHMARDAKAVVVAQVVSVQKSDQVIYDPRSRVANVRVVQHLRGLPRRQVYQKHFTQGWNDEFCASLSLRVGQRFVMTIEDNGAEPMLGAMSRRYYDKLMAQRRRRSPPNSN